MKIKKFLYAILLTTGICAPTIIFTMETDTVQATPQQITMAELLTYTPADIYMLLVSANNEHRGIVISENNGRTILNVPHDRLHSYWGRRMLGTIILDIQQTRFAAIAEARSAFVRTHNASTRVPWNIISKSIDFIKQRPELLAIPAVGSLFLPRIERFAIASCFLYAGLPAQHRPYIAKIFYTIAAVSVFFGARNIEEVFPALLIYSTMLAFCLQ